MEQLYGISITMYGILSETTQNMVYLTRVYMNLPEGI